VREVVLAVVGPVGIPPCVSSLTAVAAYDPIADWYHGQCGENADDLVAATVIDLAGPVGHARVLDLACGSGRVARTLARAGARVVAVDASARLLDIARRIDGRARESGPHVPGHALDQARVMTYDDIATQYDELVHDSFIHQVAVPAIVDLCAEGTRVLDICCGQGAATRVLARRYPDVVGVDTSAALLTIAREIPSETRPRYVRDDATRLAQLRDDAFDGATCCLATTDVDDLVGLFHAAARVLVPGGWFVIAALHPCFEAPRATQTVHDDRLVKVVGSYFCEGRWWPRDPDGMFAELGRHHRTLSTLCTLLLDAGFDIDAVHEPRAPDAVVAESPIYGEVAEVLVIRARRNSVSTSAQPAAAPVVE
jgi:ubiquinone/menaquinone biosynthesis C-methylase UbiE